MPNTIPQKVGLVLRNVGEYNVFTCADIPGLYVSDSDLRRAFDRAISALSRHASATYDCQATYVSEVSYDEFLTHLNDPGDIDAQVLSLQLTAA